ncbi:MAG TPA: hypothetical protein PKM99_03465 [Thermotogota bacterium]|nr:hypothetical protein [Thermotogota bacterium]NLZ13396.1 hypothetical protein [Thermotogaceae bacterium]MDD8040710.1 hypothetical protein [Thermotogota bacterium]MDD8052762.1 hypothetical protein [Thermotogota bacterium]HNR63001.1 hypothetical protein [Thermotogota bacterium]
MNKDYISSSSEKPVVSSAPYANQTSAVYLEQVKELSRERFFELIGVTAKILLMTAVIFAAFFVPFFVGMQTNQLNNRTSAMKIEIQSMNTKIQEYNQKITAFGEMLLVKNKIQKSEVE